jgi:hypothetical protein
LHVGAWQVSSKQIPLWQSLGSEQLSPAAQGAQSGPPQSTPVSSPFLFPSSQVALSCDAPSPSHAANKLIETAPNTAIDTFKQFRPIFLTSNPSLAMAKAKRSTEDVSYSRRERSQGR